MNDQQKGMFIVFEGIDLCGKTTQVDRLYSWFLANDEQAVITQEPTEQELSGRLLRMSLQKRIRFIQQEDDKLSEEIVRAKFFALDRYIHLKNEIEPNLTKGIHVISDRYYLSSLVYQSVTLREYGYSLMDPLERVIQLNADTFYADTQPDLIIVISITKKSWLTRRQLRLKSSGNHVEEIYEEAEQRQQILDTYENVIDRVREELGERGVHIETIRFTNESRSREDIQQEVIRLVRKARGIKMPNWQMGPLFQNLT
jgi:dTMP kinase